MYYDLVIHNVKVHTMDAQKTVLENASVAITHDKIVAIEANKFDFSTKAKQVLDGKGACLTPGLIDCHTHAVYCGRRSDDFEQRMKGASYAEIAQTGGGILSTVKAVREASFETLWTESKIRLMTMWELGTTSIEIKSGYGLTLDSELKQLYVIRSLSEQLPMHIVPTFLGAHTVPQEFKGRSEDYVNALIDHYLPRIAKEKLAFFVDAFCEEIAFSVPDVARYFEAAKAHGFQLKIHAEQLSNQGGALMASKMNACSIDHLEYLSVEDCHHLAQNKTVAVLLPGAFYFLQEKQRPPIAELRRLNIPMAIATDCNPGTSPFLSLPLMMNMACVLFNLTVQEAWLGVTRYAAQAVGELVLRGSIEVGKIADLVLWKTDKIEDIVYQPTLNYCDQIVCSGKVYQPRCSQIVS